MKNKTVLDELQAKGHNVEHGCKSGFCGMCKCKINNDFRGKISYIEPPLGMHGDDEILTCVAVLERGSLQVEINTTQEQAVLTKESAPSFDEIAQQINTAFPALEGDIATTTSLSQN